MADKKYSDYNPGTYDTAKIFLQADATTGALEKVNLPPVLPLRYYYAKIRATASGNPIATVSFNSLGVSLAFTRIGVGLYQITASGTCFDLLTTYMIIGYFSNYPVTWWISIQNATTIYFTQYGTNGVAFDNFFYVPIIINQF